MMFLYQVIDRAGRCMVSTTSRACVYAPEIERDIRRAGYRIKVQQDAPEQEDGARKQH